MVSHTVSALSAQIVSESRRLLILSDKIWSYVRIKVSLYEIFHS